MKVLIADDEPLVRKGLRLFLKDHDDVEILGECKDGLETVEAIQNLSPDLVFLDIQMPELNGLGVIESLEDSKLPLIIFVTAFDKYAVRAFEINAFDYLLKPFDQSRFEKTMQRARLRLQSETGDEEKERVRNLIEYIEQSRRHLDRIAVKSAGRIFFLQVGDIDYITSADNYVSLHVGRKEHLIRKTMQYMEDKLDPQQFLRIRQSAIINIEHLTEVVPYGNGEFIFSLKDGTKLSSSRNYRHKINELFEN